MALRFRKTYGPLVVAVTYVGGLIAAAVVKVVVEDTADAAGKKLSVLGVAQFMTDNPRPR